MTSRIVDLPDGSRVHCLIDDDAPDGSGLLVYHHGTPAAGPLGDELLVPARANGLRLVEIVRPGYGMSTRQADRSVADVVPLVAAVADSLGHERFACMGWSGGGPHALATAGLMPDRCAAALCLAGIAPFEADGLDFLAGMGEDNLEEFGAALAGPEHLRAFLDAGAAELRDVSGADVVGALASLLPEVDRVFLTGEAADHLAAELRWSVASGIWGWYDDDVAFVRPWGFDLSAIRVPTLVWQGSEDLMVPLAHGAWLAEHVDGAEATLAHGEGHLSMASRLDDAFARLRSSLA